jgi:tRNA nucleotidyltransferase (CCA-adding enzyme)
MTKFNDNKPKINEKNIPVDVLFILKKIKKAGHLSFLVGGCVRDFLLQRDIRDWDIVTDAKPKQIQKIFYQYKTFLIGKSVLTLSIIINHTEFQISTFRSIGYHHGFKDNIRNLYQILEEDLKSRDFTINAICWNPDEGLLDLVNGLRDLENKIIRSINPDIRFTEDPLRMLRAIRISCELSFNIAPEVKISISKNTFLIRLISPERIKAELAFILDSQEADKGLNLLCKFDFDRYIFGFDRIKKYQIRKTAKNKLDFRGTKELKKDLSSKLAFFGRLYYGSCKYAYLFYLPVIKFLRFPKDIIKTVEILLYNEWEEVDFKNDIKIRFFLARFGEENTWRIFLLKKALLLEEDNQLQIRYLKEEEKLIKEEIEKNSPLRISDLAINGDDLIKVGLTKGKKIGETLKMILEKVIINPDINKKGYLIKFVQNIINKTE